MTVHLTIHRSAEEIGGNCIELRTGSDRLLLDMGRPLSSESAESSDEALIPKTLDLERPVSGLIVSHPHQDHWGLVSAAPDSWPVWCGAPSEALIRISSKVVRRPLSRSFENYESGKPFELGPFRITPILTDHSAFDAHMLLIDVAGKRILYTGDFRLNGRKGVLPERLMKNPPKDVDVLLMEGTTLGRDGRYPTEDELEADFVDLFQRTPGRVFVSWSAQNIDRTVTLYRACKKSGRTLAVDIYSADVLHRLGKHISSIPQPGWPNLKVVVTRRMQWLYSERLGAGDFVERVCVPNGMRATRLNENVGRWAVMLRPALMSDYERKGVVPTADDAWSYSQWTGYLKQAAEQSMAKWFEDADSTIKHIHTSGHAEPATLKRFSKALAPKYFVPIHSFEWDDHLEEFDNVTRLRDGEEWLVE